MCDLEKRYTKIYPLLSRLKEEVHFIISSSFDKEMINIHSLTSRIKEYNSLKAKAKRKSIKNPISETNDLLGFRIICLFRSDICEIGKILRNNFIILSEDNKIDNSDISNFGYLSFHFVAKLKDEYSGPRYEGIQHIPFEIQVRTIAMDAWSIISHYIDYKTEKDVPSSLRKDFYALSGLFYVADTHFEMFYKSIIASRSEIQKLPFDKTTYSNQEINLDTIKNYLEKKFPKREQAFAISMVVGALTDAGYKTIADVDSLVERKLNDFLNYEKKNPPADGDEFADTGIILSMLELDN